MSEREPARDEVVEYLRRMNQVYLDALASRERSDLLVRMGGVFTLAGRDVRTIEGRESAFRRLVDLDALNSERFRFGQARWREHSAAMRELLTRMTARAAFESFFARLGTDPTAYEHMLSISTPRWSGDRMLLGWRDELEHNRDRVERALGVGQSAFGSLTALVYYVATYERWRVATPKYWDTVVAVGEIGATVGEVLSALGNAVEHRQALRNVQATEPRTQAAIVRRVDEPVGKTTEAGRGTSERGTGAPSVTGRSIDSASTEARATTPLPSRDEPITRAPAPPIEPEPPLLSSAPTKPKPIVAKRPARPTEGGPPVEPIRFPVEAPPPANEQQLETELRKQRRELTELADLGRATERSTKTDGRAEHGDRAIERRRLLDRAARVLDFLARTVRSRETPAVTRGVLVSLNVFDQRHIVEELWRNRHSVIAELRQGTGSERPNEGPTSSKRPPAKPLASREYVLNAVVGVVAESVARVLISDRRGAQARTAAKQLGIKAPVTEARLLTQRDTERIERRFAEAGDPGMRVAIDGERLVILGLVETKGGRRGPEQAQLDGMLRRIRTEPSRIELIDGSVRTFAVEDVVLAPELTLTTATPQDVRAPKLPRNWLAANFPGGHSHVSLPLSRDQVRELARHYLSSAAEAFRDDAQPGQLRRTRPEKLRVGEANARD